jgi:hypoxanthine phosphoribosyltransferase
MPDAEFLELSWELFGELCRVLAVKVATSGYRPEMVVGIAKAGVIPGAVVASILRCDFYSLKISRDAGGERVRARPRSCRPRPRRRPASACWWWMRSARPATRCASR